MKSARDGTDCKRPAGRLLGAFFSLLFLLNGAIQTTQLLTRIAASVQRASLSRSAIVSQQTLTDDRDRAAFQAEAGHWYGEGDSQGMRRPLGLVAFLLVLSVALFSISGTGQDLAKTDWTLEWWFTFPVPARGLLLARVLETALASPLVWFLLLPFFSVVFWCSGYSWLGVGLGLAATVYVGLLSGSLRVVAETSLRRFLSMRNVSRVQAALSILSPVVFLCAIATLSPKWLATLSAFAGRLPSWSWLNPLTLPIEITAGGARAACAALGCGATAWAAVACATTIGGHLLRDGLTTAGSPLQGTRRRGIGAAGNSARVAGGVARNELRRLSRDRTAFVQTFVLPAALVGFQLLTNSDLLRAATANPRHAAALTFSVAAFILSTGACNSFVVDVPVLWLYFTLPRSLTRLMIDKALFWSGLALAVALAVLVAVAGAHPPFLRSAAPWVVLTGVGVVLYAFIATAIGVLGTDPLETEPLRRMRVSMIYLFMSLASMFAYALYVPSAWAKVAEVLLSSLLAFALWQRVSDHTPYLLDPTAAPSSISVADGAIAALAFFFLQGALGLVLGALGWSPGASLLFGFAGAGLVVASIALFTFWRRGRRYLRR